MTTAETLLRAKTIKQILDALEVLTAQNLIQDVTELAGDLANARGDLRELLMVRDDALYAVDTIGLADAAA